jgi:hypothetical protein
MSKQSYLSNIKFSNNKSIYDPIKKFLTFSHIQGRIDIPKQGETMLGYTERDIVDMQIAINDGIFYLPPSAETTKRDLEKAFDLLQGLIFEGHVTA